MSSPSDWLIKEQLETPWHPDNSEHTPLESHWLGLIFYYQLNTITSFSLNCVNVSDRKVGSVILRACGLQAVEISIKCLTVGSDGKEQSSQP